MRPLPQEVINARLYVPPTDRVPTRPWWLRPVLASAKLYPCNRVNVFSAEAEKAYVLHRVDGASLTFFCFPQDKEEVSVEEMRKYDARCPRSAPEPRGGQVWLLERREEQIGGQRFVMGPLTKTMVDWRIAGLALHDASLRAVLWGTTEACAYDGHYHSWLLFDPLCPQAAPWTGAKEEV